MMEKILCPAVPEGTPLYKTMFRVTAEGLDVGMYSDKTYWDGCVNFGYFDLADGCAADIVVKPEFAFSSVKILPVMLGITPQAISKWENGVGYPDVTLFPDIARSLDVSLEMLFGTQVTDTK